MELGIDKHQIESFKRFWKDLSKDRVMLRFVICAGMLVVGWFSLMQPQAGALAAARKSVESAEKRSTRAAELVFFTEQLERYTPHLFTDADPVTLQDYVLDKLKRSGARLRTVVPKKTEAKGPFKVAELDLDATGSFSQLVDLVDRLEHGDKIVRLERVRFQRSKTTIMLECTVTGLVKEKRTTSTEETGAGAGAGTGTDAGAVPSGGPP